MQDIQDSGFSRSGQANSPSIFHVSVQAPHICALILLPALPAGATTGVPCHGSSYMAVDLFAAKNAAPLPQVTQFLALLKANNSFMIRKIFPAANAAPCDDHQVTHHESE